jgi:hypothetical protein
MMVREWIEVLKGLPQDYTVRFADWNEDYCKPMEIDECCVHDEDKVVVLGASEWDNGWK